ncbi:MAG: DUF2911 domain-containing protein [Acidobacteria bacterium]|nr:DUF2911 domain-containing protein [Acidobacteriota bacterium]
MNLKRVLAVVAVLCVLIVVTVAWQRQRLSPHETVEATIGGKKISITYGRPYLKGRKAVGGTLVPYGQVWRTGADEATVLKTDADLMIGSLSVPKGSYALFTLPSETGWKLIVNKTSDQWGAFNYDANQDLGRVDMKVGKTPSTVEQFTISLSSAGSGGVLKLEWENTSASVDVKVK